MSARRAIHLAIGGALLLALAHGVGAQDSVPVYNVKPECQFTQSAVPSQESEKTCLREEQAARAKLEQKWASYPSADRQECVSESSTGGSPSYSRSPDLPRDDRRCPRAAAQGQGGEVRCAKALYLMNWLV
jgi:hypothetical protein